MPQVEGVQQIQCTPPQIRVDPAEVSRMAFFRLQQVVAEGDRLMFKLARVGKVVKRCGRVIL